MERLAKVYTEGVQAGGQGAGGELLAGIGVQLECMGWLSKGCWKLYAQEEEMFYRGLNVAVQVCDFDSCVLLCSAQFLCAIWLRNWCQKQLQKDKRMCHKGSDFRADGCDHDRVW